MDSSLCNWDCLLLHGFVDGHLILNVHFVKFIYTAYAIVCEHECPCLNCHVSVLVLCDTGSKTCSRCGFAICVDTTRDKFVDTFQKLRLGCWRIPYNQNVDISSYVHLCLSLFMNATKKLKQKCLFDFRVTKYGRKQWLCQIIIKPGVFFNLLYKLYFCLSEPRIYLRKEVLISKPRLSILNFHF